MIPTSYIVDISTLAVAIVAIIISIGSTHSAKKNYVLMRTETIEQHINEFVIKHKRDIGWLPQCAVLETYPMAHIFSRPIFDDYRRLTDLERKTMFKRYKMDISTLISKDDIRKGMDLLLDDMISNNIIRERDKVQIERYMHNISEHAGNIEKVTGMPFITGVGEEHWMQTPQSNEASTDVEVHLRDYIKLFLDGKVEETPMDFILRKYGDEGGSLLASRLAKLCYFSVINLDKEDRAFHMSNEISVNIKYFEDATLSVTLGAYLVYVHDGGPFEPDIPFDMTTLSTEH